MKVKVKGLVFVGFAAMIFAANAMADPDNTVTSKAYVDNKFQTLSNLSTTLDVEAGTEDTTYPSVSAVTAALTETGNTIGTGQLSITVNSTTATFGANDSSNTTFSITGLEETDNKASAINSTNSASTTAYPTTGAVYDYVAAQLADSSNVGEGDFTVSINGTSQTFNANQATNTSLTITGLEETANKASSIDTTLSSEAKAVKYPSQAAVEDYVAGVVTDSSVVGNGQVSITVNSTTETFNMNDSTGTTFSVTGLEETGNKATAINSTNSASTTAYPTTGAVYDYVNGLPSSAVPAVPTTGADSCDATHPCALVTDSGVPTWKRIAQVGD